MRRLQPPFCLKMFKVHKGFELKVFKLTIGVLFVLFILSHSWALLVYHYQLPNLMVSFNLSVDFSRVKSITYSLSLIVYGTRVKSPFPLDFSSFHGQLVEEDKGVSYTSQNRHPRLGRIRLSEYVTYRKKSWGTGTMPDITGLCLYFSL